jgi:CheY-like chemotaxis protein
MLDAESPSPLPSEPSGWAVLIADDFAATRANLRAVISEFDPSVEIIEAKTGPQALQILQTRAPRMAFVNIQLPSVSGAEALAIAQAQGVRPFTILMSNIVMPRWVEVSTKLGAYEFLKKPFDPDHIRNLLLAHSRTRDPIKLLLVEGSHAARQLVRKLLSTSYFSFEIDETDLGQHAVKLMRLSRYDVALIDLNLPVGINGLETACQASQAAPGTKLVLMTAGDSATVEQSARHFGVTSFLRKPFFARDIEYALHVTFELRRPYLLNAVVGSAAPQLRRAVGE